MIKQIVWQICTDHELSLKISNLYNNLSMQPESCYQWLHSTVSDHSRCSSDERAMRLDKNWRQAFGQTYHDSLVSWQVADLGRHVSQHTGRLVCPPVITVCWWSGRGCGEQENFQVRRSASQSLLPATGVWNPRHNPLICNRLFECSGWSVNRSHGRPMRHDFSLAAHFCSTAVI